MKIRRTVSLALVGAALVTATAVPAVSASTPPPIDAPAGSVLDVLEADGTAYDSNWYDFDIVEVAARAVVDTKGVGGTTVAALANPDFEGTVFAPNDRAFQVLARELTGKWYGTEAGVVNAILTALGADAIDTLETVLLYHVLAGKVDFATAASLSGSSVPTVLGPTIKLKYYGWIKTLVLADKDTNDLNPWVVNSKRNIETSNGKSIIHGIALVLRPTDLP